MLIRWCRLKRKEVKDRSLFCFSKFNLRSFAFTLAEVLIVLGIIGVVAEMTIPSLSNNIQDQVQKAQLKELFSTLSQATLEIKTENEGSMIGVWPDFASAYFADTRFGLMYSKYIKVTKECYSSPYSSDASQCWHKNGTTRGPDNVLCPASSLCWCSGCSTIETVQGSWAMIDGADYNCTGGPSGKTCLNIVLDTNGIKPPNRWSYDIHTLYITTDGVAYPMTGRTFDLMTK